MRLRPAPCRISNRVDFLFRLGEAWIMFRRFAGTIPNGADTLFRLHPIQLQFLLEQDWNMRVHNTAFPLGHPDHRSDLPGFPCLDHTTLPSCLVVDNSALAKNVSWEHLIYAYMIENTRVYEIFADVVQAFASGEEVGVPVNGAEHWLRNTEELFFCKPANFMITRVVSEARENRRGVWWNAYQRMFSMDLNHAQEEKRGYPYPKAQATNTRFVENFENLLREVWIGISNLNNATGVNPTDVSAMANYAKWLQDNMLARREGGNLSREEFYAVSTLSWFHLTLEYDSPIVISLRSDGTSPDERLFNIAGKVKSKAHARARSFFELADPMSRVLLAIERGGLSTPAGARTFFDPAGGNTLPADMSHIIMQWGLVTGHDPKTRKTLVTT